MNWKQIADALCANMSHRIQKVADVLRDAGWPIPRDYELRLSVVWPDKKNRGVVLLRATIGQRTVETRVRIDGSARPIAQSYLEIGKDLWAKYVLNEHPDFVAKLRAEK